MEVNVKCAFKTCFQRSGSEIDDLLKNSHLDRRTEEKLRKWKKKIHNIKVYEMVRKNRDVTNLHGALSQITLQEDTWIFSVFSSEVAGETS